MCMNCKAELRGEMKCRYSEHECRACHRVLPESDFNAERLAMWRRQNNYEQIICLQCTPAWETKWWEKLADKSQYTCSTCKKQLPRNAYSSQGFADQKAIVCMECNRAAIVRQKNLDKKTFDCRGPCRRSKLPETAFAAATLLKKDLKTWICSSCQYPHCDMCKVQSDEAVPFGHEERKDMLRTKNYQRRWICEKCLYPPCGGCAKKRPRASKRKALHFRPWKCSACLRSDA